MPASPSATLGAGASFLLNVLSFIPVILVLFTISDRYAPSTEARPPLVRHFREGFAYMRGHRAIALPITMMAVYMLLGGSVPQLFEPFVRHVLSGSKTEYGILAAAYGIGGLLGSMALIFFGDRAQRSRIVVVGLACYVSVEILFGAAPTYGIAVGAAAVMGLMHVVTGVSFLTSIHANVEEHQRGRVSGIFQMAFLGGVPIGALAIGLVAGTTGLRAALIGAGCLLAAVSLAIAARAGGLRIIDSGLEPGGVAAPRPAVAERPS